MITYYYDITTYSITVYIVQYIQVIIQVGSALAASPASSARGFRDIRLEAEIISIPKGETGTAIRIVSRARRKALILPEASETTQAP